MIPRVWSPLLATRSSAARRRRARAARPSPRPSRPARPGRRLCSACLPPLPGRGTGSNVSRHGHEAAGRPPTLPRRVPRRDDRRDDPRQQLGRLRPHVVAAPPPALARLDADRPHLPVLPLDRRDVARLLPPDRLPGRPVALGEARPPRPPRELQDRRLRAAPALGRGAAADRPVLPGRVGGEALAVPAGAGRPRRRARSSATGPR